MRISPGPTWPAQPRCLPRSKRNWLGTSGAVSDDLRAFVVTALGNRELPAERVVARYAELVNEIRRIEALVGTFRLSSKFPARLSLLVPKNYAARMSHTRLCVRGHRERTPYCQFRGGMLGTGRALKRT